MESNALSIAYKSELLNQEDLKSIFEAHKKVIFKKGQKILEAGNTANEYFVLESGVMRSYVIDYAGKDMTTHFFSKNELIVDVSSLFQRVPSEENIEALTNCVCWQVDYQDFQKLFHSIHGFSEWGKAWMSSNMFEYKKRLVSLIANSATERYHDLMKTKPQVIRNAPLKHIASYLGVTDSSLSRIRKETSNL